MYFIKFSMFFKLELLLVEANDHENIFYKQENVMKTLKIHRRVNNKL